MKAPGAPEPWTQLQRAVRDGKVTLVLGAGVSMPFGIPGWATPAKGVWEEAFVGLSMTGESPAMAGPAPARVRRRGKGAVG